MKLLTSEQWFVVDYFGMQIIVPKYYRYLAVDSDGSLFAHRQKPELFPLDKTARWFSGFSDTFLGDVDLEGMDWRETLKEVSPA